MKIAHEGIPTIALVGLVTVVASSLSWYFLPLISSIIISTILFIIWFLSIYFFRDPERISPPNLSDDTILSPADGKVVVVKELESVEYLEKKAIQISIFLSPLNVHINRIPISGVLEYLVYQTGEYLMAWDDRATMNNEQAKFGLRHASGQKVLFRQITGFLARRVVYYIRVGDYLERNKRFGLMKFGSRMDVVLPRSANVLVKQGDKVVGGESIIAKLAI
tara:strand:- start:10402 stop:11064 length:663 start_codon:yes stop_codon:yes gene_type:complete